jgi:hypothetical protein
VKLYVLLVVLLVVGADGLGVLREDLWVSFVKNEKC